MALILHLETATPVCSVALSQSGEVKAFLESDGEKSHATRLTTSIREVFQAVGARLDEMNAISLSLGPGSYTGLRIGTSVAKGLAYALSKPLIGIPTLHALASGFSGHPDFNPDADAGKILLCPMLDARRMEVYTALYDLMLNEIRPVESLVIGPDSFKSYLDQHIIWFFGNGSEKIRPVISHPNARFSGGFRLSATFQVRLAHELYKRGDFLDTAYFEPHYLKDFIATVPKNKILGQAG